MTGIRNDNLPSQNVSTHETNGVARPQDDSAQTGPGKIGERAVRALTKEMLEGDSGALAKFGTFEKAQISRAHSTFAEQNIAPPSESSASLLDRKIALAQNDQKQATHNSFVIENFMSATRNGDGFVTACNLAKIDPNNLDDHKREQVDEQLSDLFSSKKSAATPDLSDVSVLLEKSVEVIRQIALPQRPG
ncbi:hypothetical protein [Thalassospira sp.]|uniref:hypothetical protein n=1 Tax=Thalassospira sp. TaxID=1912094 RepID=UPI000C610DAC|nr:hypothetical protein [Thalassospira sp.]MBC05432.1 hypothetical protein [Thalassospira sp.]|tara:strand:- start:2918 stop:3490 length:573 start_codon:yes stop_codon:yes gene_type:complete